MDESPEPDAIKDILEDALVRLGWQVITTPAEPDAAENLCWSGSLTGKTGLSGDEREVLSRSWPKSNFFLKLP